MIERVGDVAAELQAWFGPGWSVSSHHRADRLVRIDAAHPLSHGMIIDGIPLEDAVTYAKRGWARERDNIAAAPLDPPHAELLMGIRVMIDGERLDEHDRDVIATVLHGVGLLTRDEANWVRLIVPLM